MALKSLGCLLGLSACSSHEADVADAAADAAAAVVADAGLDADYCALQYAPTPVTITGTSPRASLDMFHFAIAGHVVSPDGGIDDSYLVTFLPTDSSCVPVELSLWIRAPYSTTGTNAALATMTTQPDALTDGTDLVTFEATQLDSPDAPAPRIVGHFVTHDDPAWSFDIAVDLVSQYDAETL